MVAERNTLKRLRQRAKLLSTIKAELKRAGVKPPALELAFTYSSPFTFDVAITRRPGNTLHIDIKGRHPKHAFPYLQAYLSTIVYQFIHCDEAVEQAIFNLSDGDAHSASPFAFSSNRKNISLLPDPHQFKFNAYEQFRKLADQQPRPWKERNSVLRWRGGDNGHGSRLCYPDLAFDTSVMQRIRLCLIAANLNAIDCKLTPEHASRHIHEYHHFGLSGGPIEESDWINDRFALDIDGYTNSWRSMLVRMHLGCCVLKVTSQFGYRQWFYDQIRPWEHFVPVKADMSDLEEMLDWVRDNDQAAHQIAQNGQAFARTQTMERTRSQAVATIEKHWAFAPSPTVP